MTNRITEVLHTAEPEPGPSVPQRQWQILAGDMREVLARTVIDKMQSMDAVGQLQLSQAAINLYWLEHNAACFDKWIDLEQMKVFP